MTEQELQDLRDWQQELVAAEARPWEPRCVSRAFRTSEEAFVFTMQSWIDLDAACSPFLLGQFPPAESAVEEFDVAFRAFGHIGTTPGKCEPEDLVVLGEKMIAVIREGFAMQVKLSPPEGCKAADCQNGLGGWLPLLACLKSQLGFSLAEALALRVGQAFGIIAAHRCNEGWQVAAETYRQRDVEDE